MPTKSKKIMKRNSKPSIHVELAKQLSKRLKLKQKGELPNMRGGCNVCSYLEKQRGGALNSKSKKELTKMINTFVRELRVDQKAHQSGGGKISQWFKSTFAGPKARKFYSDFGRGFKIGFLGASKVAEPILGIASMAVPGLLPVSAGVSIFNQLAQ